MVKGKRMHMRALSISFAFLVCSCSDPKPGAEVENWHLSSAGKGEYLFEAKGRYTDPRSGVFHKQIETVDAKGCHSIEYVEDEFVKAREGDPSSFVIRMPMRSKAKLATARFFIDFWDVSQGVNERGDTVFSEEKIVDSSVKPPSLPAESCNKSKEQLREKAKTDPDGADAEAIGSMSRDEMIATAINTAGYLCARVTDMYPQGGNIVAHCIEYRNGKGRAKYLIDTASMTVTPM